MPQDIDIPVTGCIPTYADGPALAADATSPASQPSLFATATQEHLAGPSHLARKPKRKSKSFTEGREKAKARAKKNRQREREKLDALEREKRRLEEEVEHWKMHTERLQVLARQELQRRLQQ